MNHAKAPELKTVLVVEDDPLTMRFYRAGLRSMQGIRLLEVTQGMEALEVLEKEKVDLVLTDLDMPILDGFQLAAQIIRFHPAVAVLVITGLPEEELDKRRQDLQCLRVLRKPVRLSTLMEEIHAALQAPPSGVIRGLGLEGLLQMLNWERKNATLTVQSEGRTGYLYVKDGELIHAIDDQSTGLDTACRIILWEKPDVEFVESCRVNPSFNLPMTEILMNVALMRDNMGIPSPEDPSQF
ncbi:MAG TPA: response regulator [Holophagaceae bacterium]|nr:response regulator [Holophagaceae bacterium]